MTETILKSASLKIGEVAQITGLPVKTIRYYDDLGLLAPHISRNQSVYRLFNSKVVNRLSFIKRSQSLGLTLQEIKEILSVYDQGEIPCSVAKQLLQEKLIDIENKIQQLTTLHSELAEILSSWQEATSLDVIEDSICPNINSTL